jgi:hypothetical protein
MEYIMHKIIRSVVMLFGMILLPSLVTANHDVCSELPGKWNGKAQIKWFFFNCDYDSTAHVYGSNPAQAEVRFTKISGIFLCPSEGVHNVSVDCYDGRVEMKDTQIDAAGHISKDGQTADFLGNLYVMFRYHPFKLEVNKVS